NTTAPADPGQGNTTAPADPGGGNQSPVTAPIATAPEAPTFTLTAAQCVEGKATDNVMTVDKSQVNDNLRFVATHDGKSISLKSELRAKLWTAGKLTAEDIKTAYPSFNFDYSKPMTVQPYFFDKEKAYAESLYDTTLQLTVGKSDRFIKLGDPKSLVLVDKTTLNCAPAPTDEPTTVPTGEPSTAPTGEPTPAASVTPSATASAAASVKPTASGPAAKKGKLAKTGFDSALAVTAFALMAGAGALLALKKRREASSGS
ncbi:MAG: LPXTG cell wall anchor domain-containing protein, partial [Buchananella hordeovulneris]|nr:LPXTG cell wall anchor domain-containing protein [Buchananella hordeovulneris]